MNRMVYDRKLLDEGYELRKAGKFQTALDVLERASKHAAAADEWSWRDKASVIRVMTFRDLGNDKDALAECERMLRLEPPTARQAAYFYCSALRIATGDLAGGIRDAQAFIDLLELSKLLTWYQLETTFLLQQDRSRLIEDFSKAINADPHNAVAYFCRAVIKQANLSDEAGAYADYEQAFTLAPDNPPIQQWAPKLRKDAQQYFGSVSPYQPKRFQPGIEYCSLTLWHPTEGDPGLHVDLYGVGIEHHQRVTELSVEDFEARLFARGWKFMTTRSDRSGQYRYYQRPKPNSK